ncbi:C2H2 and C2HC zinc fingers superfamily protein [Prunus dulcis]|uniref:C2H2 and C2HC zinc fingers superfamily protein n=1 Tax=Prunus dulcis TaxID=3755 RepID=A0A4Y1QPF8_PRUDU|nr:C2H2 and C2HC zinc fingers superfamily protein [Prunus dulcis]
MKSDYSRIEERKERERERTERAIEERNQSFCIFLNHLSSTIQNKEIYTRLQVGVMDVETLECKLA